MDIEQHQLSKWRRNCVRIPLMILIIIGCICWGLYFSPSSKNLAHQQAATVLHDGLACRGKGMLERLDSLDYVIDHGYGYYFTGSPRGSRWGDWQLKLLHYYQDKQSKLVHSGSCIPLHRGQIVELDYLSAAQPYAQIMLNNHQSRLWVDKELVTG
ncbi:hypothetical protein [Dongshaea marina]|uniref:hypothetical protein n=1 Tax=Dongshaea marina TaxID=2047966 RepID=UPI000D3E949E|nr:hypothetical protein [Dongshaea marina]